MNCHAPEQPERPILCYAARKQRSHDFRRSERWSVVAVHDRHLINHHDYTTTHPAPLTKDAATKIAHGLNRLLGLSDKRPDKPRARPKRGVPWQPAVDAERSRIFQQARAIRYPR